MSVLTHSLAEIDDQPKSARPATHSNMIASFHPFAEASGSQK
jgi:hypothetical protein